MFHSLKVQRENTQGITFSGQNINRLIPLNPRHVISYIRDNNVFSN